MPRRTGGSGALGWGVFGPHLLLFLLIILFLTGVCLLRLQQAPRILHLGNTAPLIYSLFRGEIPIGQYPSPDQGGTQILFGGPLLDMLHLPVGLVDNPILGVHLTYSFYELAALCLWLVLGLRARLRPAVVWTSAVIIVASSVLLDGFAENSVLCGYMLFPFFMVLVSALCNARAWAYILSGFIFGLCSAVHLAVTLLISPACLLAVVLTRQKMPRVIRLVWFCAGLLPVVLCVLPFSESPLLNIDQISPHLESDALDKMRVIRWLGYMIQDPLWIVGIGLVIGRRVRGIRLMPHELLAALWMLLGAPLHALGFSAIANEPKAYRLVSLLPGLALLDAMVLTWLADWIRSRARLGVLQRIGSSHVLIGITLFLVAVLAKHNYDARLERIQTLRKAPWAYSQHYLKYFEDIRSLPWVTGDGPVAVLGQEFGWTLDLLQFTRGGTERFKSKPATIPSRCVVLFNAWERDALAYPRGAHLIGAGLLAVQGRCLAHLEQADGAIPSRLELEASPGDQEPVSVLVLEGGGSSGPGHPAEDLSAVWHAGKELEVVHRQRCGSMTATIYRLPLFPKGDHKFAVHLPPTPEGWKISVMVLD